MSKKEELLDELFDSLKSATHYMTGMLRDLADEKYSIDEVGIDIEAIEAKAGAIAIILSEIRDLHQLGQLEDGIDVWAHYGKGA